MTIDLDAVHGGAFGDRGGPFREAEFTPPDPYADLHPLEMGAQGSILASRGIVGELKEARTRFDAANSHFNPLTMNSGLYPAESAEFHAARGQVYHLEDGAAGARLRGFGWGLGAGLGLAAIDATKELRQEHFPAAVNAPLDGTSDAVKFVVDGPLPVGIAGRWVHQQAVNGLGDNAVGNTYGVGVGGVAELALNTFAPYLAYNAGAAVYNGFVNSREAPDARMLRQANTDEHNSWDRRAWDWAGERGDANFTLGDANRTADEMVAAMHQPAGAGTSIFTPDGQNIDRVDPNYSAAMNSLIEHRGYTAEGLANFSPQEVVGLHRFGPSASLDSSTTNTDVAAVDTSTTTMDVAAVDTSATDLPAEASYG